MSISTADRVLSATNLKKQHNGSYRGNSPLRADSDSNGFWLQIDDGEHGVYKDHASGESGSLYELARALGIEPNIDKETNRFIVDNSKRSYKNLAEYAEAKGVSVEVFTAAGWRDEVVEGRPALVFKTANGERVRFIDNKQPVGDKKFAVYRALHTGYKNCWYGLSRALQLSISSGQPLVLCNGEASTVVAQHYGIPAFCGTGGEGTIREEVIEELRQKYTGKIIIALDCDKTGKEASEKLKERLGDSVVIDLGLSNKGDLADFCKLHHVYASKALERIVTPVITAPETSDTSAIDAISFVGTHALLQRFNKIIYDEPALFGRVIRMPYAKLREAGGFANMMTTRKVILIGNVSGGGKTILSESLADGFNADGYNVIYIGDEWSSDEMIARTIQRANPSPKPFTFNDCMAFVAGQRTITDAEYADIALAYRNVRTRTGQTFYTEIKAGGNNLGLKVYLENILSGVARKLEDFRKSGNQIDVVILDYLSLYGTAIQGNNVEELKLDMFKDFCKANDVLGISTSQITKSAESDVKNKGELIQAHDLYSIRADKSNLALSMNRVYRTRFEQYKDTNPSTMYNAVHDEMGELIETPNMAMMVLKNSVASSKEMIYFHFDWAHMRLVEGLHQDYYYNAQYGIVMEREEVKAMRKAKEEQDHYL